MSELDTFLHTSRLKHPAHLQLVEAHISGGLISKSTIDMIAEHPDKTEITLSGLTQETFEYFVGTYGARFRAIQFWKCPKVENLSLLATLPDLQYLGFYWNQHATKLWDLSKSRSLLGLNFKDFTRMPDISPVADAPALEELDFGDAVMPSYQLRTLEPVGLCKKLTRLTFTLKSLDDGRIEPLGNLQTLRRLFFPSNFFTTEQVAWLKARLPEGVESEVLNASFRLNSPIPDKGKIKDTMVVGKRKPVLDSQQDSTKLARYEAQFQDRVAWFRAHPGAGPGDYPG